MDRKSSAQGTISDPPVVRRRGSRVVSAAVTPGLMAFLGSVRLRDRPHRLLRWFRQVDPTHRSPFGFWVLTRHADVERALHDPRLGTDEANLDLDLLRIGPLRRFLGSPSADPTGPFLDLSSDLMLFRDPPDHTRLRRLVSRAFTPRRVAAMEDHITAVAEDLIGPLRGRRRFDLMEELAYPFPARVICELLGLPVDDHELIAEHGRRLAVGLDPMPSAEQWRAADEAVIALRRHLTPVFEDRRLRPRDDLLSDLVTAADGGGRLTEDELLATVVLLLIAGHETTANLIGNSMVVLDAHPVERERLRRGTVDPSTAVEELLRYDPPVQMTQRIAREPLELAGESVPAGTMIILPVVAANRDPEVFVDPDRLDLGRSSNPHLTFGGGPHYCLGAALARMEGRIVLPMLLRTLSDLRVARPIPRHRPSFTIRGYAELPVEQP